MGRINVLDEKTANQIKAGEVIERPVSVIKELVDNSIDSGADTITIEFENGGISLMRVTDNGIGMDSEDARKAFLIHATSKIRSIEDIYDLSTQGFRGEALASIASCSNVTLVTKMADAKTGTRVIYEQGRFIKEEEAPSDTGTMVTVTDLFANIPARYKFLKKDSTEGMYICSLVEKLAVVNPHISFKLLKDGKMILSTPGSGDMKDTIYSIYGKNTVSSLLPVDYEYEGMKIRGFTGKTDLVRGNRGLQYIYVNERTVVNKTASAAIDEAYKGSVMKNRFPVCFLCIYVPSGLVDVNVHPRKAEVKFTNESDVFRLVFHGIKQALSEQSDTKFFSGFEKEAPEVLKTKPGDTFEHKQMRFETSSRPSREEAPTAAQSKATADLLKILSEFKPDIEAMEDKEPEVIKPAPAVEPELIPAVTEERPDSDIDELLKSRIQGFIFNTYIIAESGDNVFFVDQHAAHERVLYERFSAKKTEDDGRQRDVQTLLVPEVIELTTADFAFVSDNCGRFSEYGFDIEVLGDRQIALRSVPVATRAEDRLKSMSKPSVFFTKILEDLKKDVPTKGHIWDTLIQTTACKAAIKAHDKITVEEAQELIRQLGECKDPYHCAHGRPTFLKFSQTDLEKDFKRIV